MELDSDRPSPAKVAEVENAISQAVFILELHRQEMTGEQYACSTVALFPHLTAT
jgi:hypothetical protein